MIKRDGQKENQDILEGKKDTRERKEMGGTNRGKWGWTKGIKRRE